MAENLPFCIGCHHPQDEVRVREMAEKLNPELPQNQAISSLLDRGWQNEELMRRLNPWKMVLVTLVITPYLVFKAITLLRFANLDDRWAVSVAGLFGFIAFCSLLAQLRRGRMTWFLKKKISDDV